MPFIDINGMRVAYEDAGTGLPIVFIPGLVGAKDWFRCQLTGLRESYRIISYNVRSARGFGAYNLDLLTDDLVCLLNTLKLESAIIAGHCFGAMIAQNIARTHRDRVDALVLISGFPSLPEAPQDTLIELMSPGQVRLESPLQAILRRLFRSKPPAPPEDVEGTAWLAAHSPQLLRATLDARIGLVRRFDSSQWLAEIEAPTLVIVGAWNRAPFLAGAQLLYEGIPEAELEVIEDGDHFCFFSHHDIVNTVIDEFLTKHLSRL